MNDKGAVKSEGFGIKDADIKIYTAGCEQIKIGCSEDDDIIIYDQEVNEPSGLIVVPYGNIYDYDIITVLNHRFLFFDNYIYTLSEGITVNNQQLLIFPVESNENQFKYPKFNRSTRIEYRLPDEEINILYPEKKPSPPTGQLIASIIPALAMIVLTIVIRGILAGGSMFIYYSIGINTVGISMSIYNYKRNKKRYEANLNERITKYYTYLNEKEKKIS